MKAWKAAGWIGGLAMSLGMAPAGAAEKCELIRDPAGYQYLECDAAKIKAAREKAAEAERTAPPPEKPGHAQSVEEFAARMAILNAKSEEERKAAQAKAAEIEAIEGKKRAEQADAEKREAEAAEKARRSAAAGSRDSAGTKAASGPAPAKSSEPARAAPATTGYWKASFDENKMDGRQKLFVILEGSEPYPSNITRRAPALIVRCEAGKVELYLNARTHLAGPGDDLHSHRFRVRFDGEKPEVLVGGKATSSDAVFFPNAARYVERMRYAKELMVEVTPYQFAPSVSTFLVGGLDQHKAEMDRHCRGKGR